MSDEHKSAELVKIAEENGWSAEVVPEFPADFDDNPDANRIKWNFYAMRGDEKIHVVYRGDRMLEDNVYRFGSYTRYPQRRVAVVRFLEGQPDVSKRKDATPESLIQNRNVDWTDETPALDILLQVLGSGITWIRKMDGQIQEANIPRDSNLGSKYFRIYEHPRNGRYLEFTNFEGFHTVAVDSIVSVG